jgi:large subunit ribosomal protein L9
MKLVLIQDVKKVGRKGDVVSVKSGYGLNFLIPQGFAVPATNQHLAKVNKLKTEQQASATAYAAIIQDVIAKIEAAETFTITAKANEKGGLYEVVSEEVIVKAIVDTFGITLTTNDVAIVSSIKELGSHTFIVGDDRTRKELNIEVVATEE